MRKMVLLCVIGIFLSSAVNAQLIVGLRDISEDLEIIVEAVTTTKARLEEQGHQVAVSKTRSIDAAHLSDDVIAILIESSKD